MYFAFGKHLIGCNGGEQKEFAEFTQDKHAY